MCLECEKTIYDYKENKNKFFFNFYILLNFLITNKSDLTNKNKQCLYMSKYMSGISCILNNSAKNDRVRRDITVRNLLKFCYFLIQILIIFREQIVTFIFF